MKNRLKLSVGCYLSGILIIATTALIYLFTPEILPYQATALGVSWDDLNPGVQTQIMSLVRISGGGYLATAIALATMLFIPFRKGERWARLAIPAIGIPAALIVTYAGLTIIQNTPGRPPVLAAPVTVILFFMGFMLSSNRMQRLRRIWSRDRSSSS